MSMKEINHKMEEALDDGDIGLAGHYAELLLSLDSEAL